jgi:hypothetical protein
MKRIANQTIKHISVSLLALITISSAIDTAQASPKNHRRVIAENISSVSNYQINGTDASYLGAGINGGLTSGITAAEQSKSGGTLYGRFALPQTKISARGGVTFTDKISALTPKLTYDVAVAPGTNIFFGGGYNFVSDRNTNTPLGNKSTPVISLGAESQLANNVVIFGGADLGLNAYENTNSSAISIQGGAGFRF